MKDRKLRLMPDSLQGRYLLTAIIFITAIVFGAWWSSQQVFHVQHESISNISVRVQSDRITQRIRFLLWDSNHALQAYMIEPEDAMAEKIEDSLSQSFQHIGSLIHIPVDNASNLKSLIDRLNSKIHSLHKELKTLIDIRRDPSRLHPAMSTMNEVMLPMSNEYQTAASLALEEVEDTTDVSHSQELYKLLDRLSDTWVKMIGAFRVFVANRFGAFSISEQGLLAQAGNVETLYAQIRRVLAVLDQFARQGKLDLQTEESRKILRRTSEKWFSAYKEVRVAYISKSWRNDIPLLQGKVQPLFLGVWNMLEEIDLLIETQSARDVEKMGGMAGKISGMLWLFTALAFIVTVMGFVFLKNKVLEPVNTLSNALMSEVLDDDKQDIKQADVSEMKQLVTAFVRMRDHVNERRDVLEQQALHDPLTGLPNRVLLLDRLEHAIFKAQRDLGTIAVLFIDLDGFKEVNDTHGHHAGDEVLNEVGRRLSSELRSSGTVARIGGDEFAIILPDVDKRKASKIAERILESFETPYPLNNHMLTIRMSIGVAMYPENGRTAGRLINLADATMYQSKKIEGSSISYYFDPC